MEKQRSDRFTTDPSGDEILTAGKFQLYKHRNITHLINAVSPARVLDDNAVELELKISAAC